VPLLARQRAGLPGQRGQQLGALAVERLQLVAGEVLLGGAEQVAELHQRLDLRAVRPDQQVAHPGGGAGLGQLGDRLGQAPVAGVPGLVAPLRAQGGELLGGHLVELVGHVLEVHAGTLPRGTPDRAASRE
jgi:hypothetical protein